MSISPEASKRHANGMQAARDAKRLRTAVESSAETLRTVWPDTPDYMYRAQ
jgi:hypothetical protein